MFLSTSIQSVYFSSTSLLMCIVELAFILSNCTSVCVNSSNFFHATLYCCTHFGWFCVSTGHCAY